MLEPDPARRAALYGELQRRLQADSPFVILFQEKSLVAAREAVKGFVLGLTSDQTLYRNVFK